MYIRSIGIAGLLTGILFKLLHWPGANIILVTGGLLTIVTLAILLFRKPGPWSVQLRRPALLFASVATAIGGVLFKGMHWPGANIMLVIGVTACVLWLLMPDRKQAAERT